MPELDLSAVSLAYAQRVAEHCPKHFALAQRTLERLAPAEWTLEWYLPWWFGNACGVAPALSEQLVLSNLLGLVSIRLRDDLADGEVAPDSIGAAWELAPALYEQAISIYRLLFPASSPFWNEFTRCMQEWDESLNPQARPAAVGIATRVQAEPISLARRGAPLKISVFAIGRLTNHGHKVGTLNDCLDHALIGKVLYDHTCDWESDLAAGRWNAFVAALSGLPQTRAFRSQNRAAVLSGLLTGSGVRTYFERIRFQVIRAVELSEALAITDLSAHLREFAACAGSLSEVLGTHYPSLLADATMHLFGYLYAPERARR